MDLKSLLTAILKDYALPIDGDHGVSHWARVFENGRRLCERTNANLDVVSLFAVLHDSQRVNELHDPQHGPRAAEFAKRIRGKLIELDDESFHSLCIACEGHTHERTHADVTIQTCWDSDRLDLGRVGITPHRDYLCTAAAKDPKMIRWADGRAALRFVPEFVAEEWGLRLGRHMNP
jgi:uncharacterized protein